MHLPASATRPLHDCPEPITTWTSSSASPLPQTNVRSIWDAEWGHPRRLWCVRPEPCEGLRDTSALGMPWQGFHSYILRSNSGLIIQFRSKALPLDSLTTKLVKQVRGHLAPATIYHGLMLNSLSVWVMEVIAGIGYLFIASIITIAKLDIIVIDFAK